MSSKKQPKSKRLKKKRAKEYRAGLLARAGYTPKEQKRTDPEVLEKEFKRQVRNERERNRRQANRKKLLEHEIPLSIITAERLDNKSFDNLTPEQIRDFRLKGKKLDFLKANGISYAKSKDDLGLSWAKLSEKYGLENPFGFNSRKVYHGDTYLYVGFAQKVEGLKLENMKGWSDDELADKIRERYKEAIDTPDGSKSFAGAFAVYVGSKEDAEQVAEDYFDRDYKMSPGRRVFKLNTDSYSKVTLRSDFSQRRFHELIYTSISQMRNDQVSGFMDKMRLFCEENGFPFYDNLKL